YSKALENADSCLYYQSKLLDFNTLDQQVPNPFGELNEEVIFHASLLAGSGALVSIDARVNYSLYQKYADEDMRKHLFFSIRTDNSIQFKGIYLNSLYGVFSGIAAGEMYLTKAEIGRAHV